MRGGGVVLVNISSYSDQYNVEKKEHLDIRTVRLQHLRFSTPIRNTYKRFFLIFTKLKFDCSHYTYLYRLVFSVNIKL